MAGRFSAKRVAAPELVPAQETALQGVSWTVFAEASAAPAPSAGRFSAKRVAAPEVVPAQETALEGVSWTVFPEAAAEPPPSAAAAPNPLLTDKLLDAKVRLHRRLIEEINLAALEKLPEEEIRNHIQQLVSQYVLVERLA